MAKAFFYNHIEEKKIPAEGQVCNLSLRIGCPRKDTVLPPTCDKQTLSSLHFLEGDFLFSQ